MAGAGQCIQRLHVEEAPCRKEKTGVAHDGKEGQPPGPTGGHQDGPENDVHQIEKGEGVHGATGKGQEHGQKDHIKMHDEPEEPFRRSNPAAFEKMEFTAIMHSIMTPTARYADVILPSLSLRGDEMIR